MLQNGQSADEIAKAFTAELNDAIKKKDAEDRKAKEAALQNSAKLEDADYLARVINDFFAKWYPVESSTTKITGKDIIDMTDAATKFTKTLHDLADLFDPDMFKIEHKESDNGKCKETKAVYSNKGDAADIFAKFFAENDI